MHFHRRAANLEKLRASALAVLAMVVFSSVAFAQNSSKLGTRPGQRPIQLWPKPESNKKKTPPSLLTIGGWTYRAERSGVVRDGVPWHLIVEPASENEGWQKGRPRTALPVVMAERSKADKATKTPDAVPVIELPDAVWRKWMGPDMQDVVGIHYHELVTNDTARILYTLHKVPADDPKAPAGKSGSATVGTRVEATLLSPVTYSLDQTVLVRADPLDKSLAKSRGEHEAGHAALSQDVFVAVLNGPQDWNAATSRGRRSEVEFFWKREQIGRSWKGYRGGVGKVLALRTTIAMVPPTRWSMLLPIPPERVTQKHIQQFNDAIVAMGPLFNATDSAAQERFHAQHGTFEIAKP